MQTAPDDVCDSQRQYHAQGTQCSRYWVRCRSCQIYRVLRVRWGTAQRTDIRLSSCPARSQTKRRARFPTYLGLHPSYLTNQRPDFAALRSSAPNVHRIPTFATSPSPSIRVSFCDIAGQSPRLSFRLIHNLTSNCWPALLCPRVGNESRPGFYCPWPFRLPFCTAPALSSLDENLTSGATATNFRAAEPSSTFERRQADQAASQSGAESEARKKEHRECLPPAS